MLDNEILHYNHDVNLMKCDPWIIGLVSILSAYNGDYVNTLETRHSLSFIESGLKSMWGITDRETYDERAKGLMAANCSRDYQKSLTYIKSYQSCINNANGLIKFVVKALPNIGIIYYQAVNKVDLRKIAQELNSGNTVELGAMLTNSVDWSKQLQESGIGSLDNSRSLLAWDAVRLANISRWSLHMNYIDFATFEQNCNALKQQLQLDYDSWQQVALDYIIGGLIWDGSEERATELIKGVKLLLNDAISPINRVQFK